VNVAYFNVIIIRNVVKELIILRSYLLWWYTDLNEWRALSQNFINSSISEWHWCLEYVVQQDGEHSEHFSVWIDSVYSNGVTHSFVVQFCSSVLHIKRHIGIGPVNFGLINFGPPCIWEYNDANRNLALCTWVFILSAVVP